jgi:hypothetical protein
MGGSFGAFLFHQKSVVIAGASGKTPLESKQDVLKTEGQVLALVPFGFLQMIELYYQLPNGRCQLLNVPLEFSNIVRVPFRPVVEPE